MLSARARAIATTRARVTGAAVLLVAALALAAGITQPDPFAGNRSYWAVFDTAQGLGAIDRDVRVAGVRVGTIGDVERDGEDARAELVLFEDVPLHVDARADMRPHTLFEGSNFVDLDPGSPSAPRMPEGGTIPLEQTTSYVTLDKALRVLRPPIREGLRDVATAGDRTLRGRGIAGARRALRAAPGLMRRVAPAARALQGRRRTELAGAIAGLATTVDAVAARERDLPPLVQRLGRTEGALLADRGAALDGALARLPGALRELHRGTPALATTIDRLDRFAAAANPALPDLARALARITPALDRLPPVLRAGTPLVRDARAIAARLGRAAPELIEMFRLMRGPLRIFGNSLDLINRPTIHGAPSYRQVVAGAFSGADAVFRSYQTRAQNPLGSGHVWRLGSTAAPGSLPGPVDDQRGGAALPLASCADVRRVSPRAARDLAAWGGCR